MERLELIESRINRSRMSGAYPTLDPKDIDWLITEVRQFRSLHASCLQEALDLENQLEACGNATLE